MEILGYIGFVVLILFAIAWTNLVRKTLDMGVGTILGTLFFVVSALVLGISGANKLHSLWIIPLGFILSVLIGTLTYADPTSFKLLRYLASAFANIVRFGIPADRINAAQDALLTAQKKTEKNKDKRYWYNLMRNILTDWRYYINVDCLQGRGIMGIFSKRIYIKKESFPTIISNLSRALESAREQYIFGVRSIIYNKGIDMSQIPRDIIHGSELEDVLIGFQLTSVIGIAHNYIKSEERYEFGMLLSSHMGAPKNGLLEQWALLYKFYLHNPNLLGCHTEYKEVPRATNYRTKYTAHQGNTEALSKSLAADVHMAMGSPELRKDILIWYERAARQFGLLCQFETHIACGDEKTAKQLKKYMYR